MIKTASTIEKHNKFSHYHESSSNTLYLGIASIIKPNIN
jgi:hypothetical protein